MGTVVWAGGTDANWGTGGNWVGGVAPVNGDDVVLASTNATFPDITAGLTTGINLNSLTITAGWSGRIGTAAAALSIAITNGGAKKLTIAGMGEYIKITGNVTNSEIQHPTGTLYVTGGTWGTTGVHNISGKMEIDAAATMAGTWNVTPTANLRVGANATAIPALYCKGGIVYIDGRDVTASNSDGTLFTIVNDGQLAAHVIQSGTVRLWNTGTNASIENRGGFLTLEGNRQSTAPVITLYTAWPGARELLTWGHLSVTPGTTTPIGARRAASGAATS